MLVHVVFLFCDIFYALKIFFSFNFVFIPFNKTIPDDIRHHTTMF